MLDETMDDMDKNKDGFVTEQEYVGEPIYTLHYSFEDVFSDDIWPHHERDFTEEEPEWLVSEREHFSTHRCVCVCVVLSLRLPPPASSPQRYRWRWPTEQGGTQTVDHARQL